MNLDENIGAAKDLTKQHRYLLYLLLLSSLIFLPFLGGRDLWAPVEPRYAEIARVMFIKGEWIVPTVNGQLYTDKPILYFWLVLLASKLVGFVNEWTLRLPAALAGVGLVLTTYAIGRDFFGLRVGFIAAAILATTARVIWEARWAHTDTLLALFVALSLYFAARAVLGKGRPREMLIAYILMALATLTKGLIGVVLPALILVAFVAVRRDWRILLQARLPLGILLFMAVTAPWFIAVNNATGGQWLNDFIYIHHFKRFTAGAGHREPLYYYFTTLPADFLPWTIFAVPALFAFRFRSKWPQEPVPLFFTLWFVVIFVFFSLSDTKRDLYLLPLFPVAALFVGIYLDALIGGKLPQTGLYRWSALIFFSLLGITCLATSIVAWFFQRDAVWAVLPSAVAMVAGAFSTCAYVRRRLPWRVFFCTTLTMLFGIVTAASGVFPFIDRYKSVRPLAEKIKRHVLSTAPLYVYADTMNDFNFYTEREVIPVVSSPSQLEELLRQTQVGYMVIKERDMERFGQIAKERVLVKEGAPGRSWYLIALGKRPGS